MGQTATAIDKANATDTTVTTTGTSTGSQKQCMICFDKEADDMSLVCVGTDACDHWTCLHCLKTYLIHCENDRKITAECPHVDCQAVVDAELANAVLGRAYTPKEWKKSSDQDALVGKLTEKEDEEKKEEELESEKAFAKWLAENEDLVQQCQYCNVWIYREDGCDSMQCLCGYRFCWQCRTATSDSACQCEWELEHFYDNIQRVEGLGREEQLATKEDLADFAKYYRRKKNDKADEDGVGNEEE